MPTANINLQPFMFSPMANGVNMATQIPDQIQGLQKNYYTNQILGATAQYAPQIAAADLALKLGEINYLPAKYMSPMVGNFARLLGAGTNVQNSLSRFLATPAGAQFAKANPDLMSALQAGAGSQSNILNQGVAGGAIPANGMPYFAPQITSDSVNQINQMYQSMGGKGNLLPSTAAVTPNAIPTASAPVVAPTASPTSAPAQAPASAPTATTSPDVAAAVTANAQEAMKKSTDSNTRQRNLYATNIDKTLSMIDPDALFNPKFSGAAGEIAKGGQFAKGLAGLNQDPDYVNYQTSKSAANILTSQVNKFYDGSVQPAAQDALNNILSPGSPGMSAATKKAIFNKNVQILKNEMDTYRQAMQGTGVYTGNDSSAPGVNPGFSQQDVANLKQALPLPSSDQQKIAKQFSQNDLEYTAKKYGMTVDQVKQKLGVQ